MRSFNMVDFIKEMGWDPEEVFVVEMEPTDAFRAAENKMHRAAQEVRAGTHIPLDDRPDPATFTPFSPDKAYVIKAEQHVSGAGPVT
jgi:hypothetical protein